MSMDERIEAWFLRWQHRPFSWGKADCVQAAADALATIHGIAVVLPAYSTAFRARRLLARRGGLLKAMQAAGLEPRAHHGQGQRGDIVLAQGADATGHEYSLGVCTGIYAHAPGSLGLVPVPRWHWHSVWAPVAAPTTAACEVAHA